MRHLIILFGLLLFSFGCSKTQTTPTSLKVFIGGLQGMPTGIGDGGAILYGRSKDGKLFGRMIKGNDELVEIPNGEWMFYAFFWDTSSTALDGKVYCAKSPAVLTGTDVTVNINATNANCSDPEFSNNRVYQTGSPIVNRFADFFMEDCDNLVAGSYTCGLHNQGNALSYRYVFTEFKKAPDTPFLFSPNKIVSACQVVGEGTGQNTKQRAPINFPAGNGVVPFVVQVEMFYGATDCNVNDPKGFATHTFQLGLGQNSIGSQHLTSTTSCVQGSSAHYNGGLASDIEKKCDDDLSMVNAGSCTLTNFPETIKRFMPSAQCGTAPVAATPAIKQMVMTSKDFICQKYMNSSSQIGSNPFAAGDGSRYRQFKICTEWQLNQIGEVNAPLIYSNKWYKLLNDLDMNKADFGPYAKPSCVGATGSLVRPHHNLNPLDKIAHGSCDVEKTSENNGFQGVFNGNGKTIRNARISAESISQLGFTRKMFGGSRIQNLNFEGLEVRGRDYIGGVAGFVEAGNASIRNVVLKDLDIEGRGSNTEGQYVGAVTGHLDGGAPKSSIIKVRAEGVDLRGTNFVGGLVGNNFGEIQDSSFRGWIDQYYQNSYYIGGLVGYNQTGAIINRSFSEGEMNTWGEFSSGIAGKNMGDISNVYSSMIVQANYNSGNAQVSGIAYNFGSISNAVFTGSLYASGGSPIYAGIANSGTLSNCSSTYSPVGNASCFEYTDDEMRSNSAPISDSTQWSMVNGSWPRLVYETRECLSALSLSSVATQIANGRGGVLNPVHICRPSQFSEMNARASGEYYRLMDDMYIGNVSSIETFNGTLLGNHRFLYGFVRSFSDDALDENIGLFKVNSGRIQNLQLAHSIISNTDPSDLSSGILVGKNLGSIADVLVSSSSITAPMNVGTIAGENYGDIKHSHVDYSKSQGIDTVGGVVGLNGLSGKIQLVSANVEVGDSGGVSGFQSFGGVAGKNNGQIDQVEFKGRMMFNSPSTAPLGVQAGGIVGHNLGDVANALVPPYSRLQVRNSNTVGGLIGRNAVSGSLLSSVFLGKVVFDHSMSIATANDDLHPLIGLNNATVGDVTNSFYYKSSIGSVIESPNSVSTVSGTDPGPYTHSLNTTSQTGFQSGTNALSRVDLIEVTNSNNGKINMFPVEVIVNDTFVSDFLVNNGSWITPMKSFSYSSSYNAGELLASDISDINRYCSSFTGTLGREVCSSGLNIVYADDANMANSKGYDRMLDYYKSLMYKTNIPADAPIWSLDAGGDEYPRLIQLDD